MKILARTFCLCGKRSLFLAKKNTLFWSEIFQEKTFEEDLHERWERNYTEVPISEYKLKQFDI